MGTPKSDQKRPDGLIDGFSATSPTKIFWNSRKRTANGQSLDQVMEESLKEGSKTDDPMGATEKMEDKTPVLSDRRKALFEPLEPTNISNERRLRPSAETLLPPPDFDDASYPRGWLVGKKRKLVNVDVVESMRRIAVQEMNRKRDRRPERAVGRRCAVPGTPAAAASARKKQAGRCGEGESPA
ncbi:protein HEADING DATE REPRESSOR 1 isoform X2 [Magnolia sinica]|uniref:protein HEADING DATE REPRESSOR 1 isoform X2 n=1 Tax=Magnolia sinica TaxID=86752 RepID=UPI00265A3B43|nr:protein HEADING DATE REPRESSOR 1 isoform X2 [Magnolia sinica]